MKDVIEILSDLISLPSCNPADRDDMDGMLHGEFRVLEYIYDFMKSIGLEPYIQETGLKGRQNVGAVLYSGDKCKTIVMQAHMDTVGINGNMGLLSPMIKNGRVYGRGACDDKGVLACMLAALEMAAREKVSPANNIIITGVSDEEYTGRGSIALISQRPSMNADFGVVGEPTECRIVNAYKGLARWRIETTGKACHSSRPQCGVNAIYRMAGILRLIEEYEGGLSHISDDLLGEETISVGTIQGGNAVNIVPDSCRIEIDRRLTRKTSPGQAHKDLDDYLKSRGAGSGFNSLPMYDAQDAAVIDGDHPGVKMLIDISRRLNLNPIPACVSFGSDAFRMNKAGIPTVLWGPGCIDMAHTKNEFVPVDELVKAVKFYYGIIETPMV